MMAWCCSCGKQLQYYRGKVWLVIVKLQRVSCLKNVRLVETSCVTLFFISYLHQIWYKPCLDDPELNLCIRFFWCHLTLVCNWLSKLVKLGCHALMQNSIRNCIRIIAAQMCKILFGSTPRGHYSSNITWHFLQFCWWNLIQKFFMSN